MVEVDGELGEDTGGHQIVFKLFSDAPGQRRRKDAARVDGSEMTEMQRSTS